MTSHETRTMARLDTEAKQFLEDMDGTALSPRGYYRVLKVARTIADLDAREKISAADLAEAFGYRIRMGES